MSRSRKKNAYGSISCRGTIPGAESSYKRMAHRQLRRTVRRCLDAGDFDGIPSDRCFGDPYWGPKDGKWRWYGPAAHRK